MKLYQNPASPPCRRVLATIFHLGLEVELVDVQFHSGQLESPDYRRMNPNGAVPLLDDGGFYLWESTAIMTYLCDKQGATELYPQHLQKRADVNRWLAWSNAQLGPVTGTLVWENLIKGWLKIGGPDPKEVAEAEKDFHRCAKVLDQELLGRGFLCGGRLTLADFALGANMMHAEMGRFPLEKYRNIRDWLKLLDGVDAWKKSAPTMS